MISEDEAVGLMARAMRRSMTDDPQDLHRRARQALAALKDAGYLDNERSAAHAAADGMVGSVLAVLSEWVPEPHQLVIRREAIGHLRSYADLRGVNVAIPPIKKVS